MSRFENQIKLKGFEKAGQDKLKGASVLVIGAGGLGCPVLLYLSAAGVGTIGIIDGDNVSLSNLNRQVIYGESDVTNAKVTVAANHIRNKYSDIDVVAIPEFITTGNAVKYISRYDVIIDCTDNFSARYIINDACVLLDKPLVFGAVYQYEGHMAVFNVRGATGEKSNYRDIFPVMPGISDVPDCNALGVIGILPGIIGTLMASEGIKLLSGYTTSYANKVLWYNMKRNAFYETNLRHNPFSENTMPFGIEEFENTDYHIACPKTISIDWERALNKDSYPSENVLFIDVRNEDEQPGAEWVNHVNIPLSRIDTLSNYPDLPDTIFFFCQSGSRSIKAIERAGKLFSEKELYSIDGGVNAYLKLKASI